MAYTMNDQDWMTLINFKCYDKQGYRLPKVPIPMRPIYDRTIEETEHFVVMYACTNKYGGRKVALIERACSSIKVTRIDQRLKTIKRIIRINQVPNNHLNWRRAFNRMTTEQLELMLKCEHMYPCHFLVRGVSYAITTEA